MNKKILIIGVVITLAVTGIIVFRLATGSKESPYEFINVERGTLVERVLATGTVKKADEIALAFASSGRVKSISVKVGEHAETGKELARLDTATLEAQIRNAEAALRTAEANLIRAQAGSSEQDIAVAQAAVTSAEVALENAENAASKALDSAYLTAYNTIQTVQAKTDNAIQELDNYFQPCGSSQCWNNWGAFYTTLEAVRNAEAQKVLADSARLRINSTILSVAGSSATLAIDSAINSLITDVGVVRAASQATYDALQTDAQKTSVQTVIVDLDTLIAALRSNQQSITSVKSSNSSSINTAQSALTSAQAQLDKIKATPRAIDIEPLRAQVMQARANVDAAKAAFENAIIRAPLTGTVVEISIRPGEITGVTGSAMKFMPDAPFSIESNIPEADIADLTLNDPLSITLDAVKNVEYWGRIISIDPASKNVGGVVTYRVIMSIEDGDEKIKTGMTANLDIETDRRESVLSVPQRSVIEQSGKRYVRILNNKQIENIEVVVGIRSADGLIEIKSGVNEGVEIISFVRAQ